jgi:DNA repair protein RadD
MAELRPYQVNITAEFYSRRAAGARSILLLAPNGSRKRIIAASIGMLAVAAGQRVMAIARRREIIEQTVRKLRDKGIDPGIIRAGLGDDPLAVVQVASVQTLHRSAMRGTQLALPAADSLIIEACHHATARTWRAVIEAYPGAVRLGLTATPSRRAEQDPHPCRGSTTSSRAFICLVQRPTTAGHGGLDKAFLGLAQRDLSSGRNE